jgi:tRNA threonylcarbamoyladenosine biosynthesis protein TsaB
VIALGVTTSTWRGGAALVGPGLDATAPTLLGVCEYEGADDHAERLFPTVEEALRIAGVHKREIGLVVCDVGPGSFTGVRAATAALSAIAWTLRVPTVPVVSLAAMAWAARSVAGGRAVMSILDGRRNELYFAVYQGEREVVDPRHLSLLQLAELDAARTVHDALVIGEFAATLPGFDPLRSAELDLPSAAIIARIGLEQARGSAGLVPVYVRSPDAKTTEELARARSR